MVEVKGAAYVMEGDDGSDDSPPLVEASHVIPDLHSIEPMMVSVVTIDGADPLCQSSVISSDSVEAVAFSDDSDPETAPSSRKWSAGIAGGVLGTLLAGPVVGLVAGGAAAYYANKDGAAGDVSRAMADVASTTGKKAKELNEKHHLLDKSKEAAGDAWVAVKNLNDEHNITERSQAAAKKAWRNAKEFDQKHRVVDKIAAFSILCFKRIVKLLEQFADRLKQIEQNKSSTESTPKVAQPVRQPATCY
ncbi:expressed unknown protein [Seminavis robusta]|uniref:Uncharacterized protein n=1 Tax=Seminavis robusta TaxID=568900 RepID=A0A9N8EUM0_9STRA|nr:expressed unknown protein [Seminavis robusta]|eukprot:Sro1926_g305880.1 n/a (248) ;mRNA; r:8575-9318